MQRTAHAPALGRGIVLAEGWLHAGAMDKVPVPDVKTLLLERWRSGSRPGARKDPWVLAVITEGGH